MKGEVTRSFRISVDVDASIEDVWRAVTDAQELVRWFPLQAEVKPGEGGTMRWAWGESWDGTMTIERWQPPRLLRLVDPSRTSYDTEGNRLTQEGGATPIAIEILVESVAGKTRVTLVHSGFGFGASWDDELDGVSHGWATELRSLKHYLERHRGKDRTWAWAHVSTPLPIPVAWARLTGPGGWRLAGELEEGGAYSVKSPSNDVFGGEVLLHIPARELTGTVRDMGDGFFRLSTYRAAGKTGLTVWLAVWDADAEVLRGFQQAADKALKTLFA